MKVQNMTNSNGNKAANQFIIESGCANVYSKMFQSYNSCIVRIDTVNGMEKIFLDANTWNYSVTTSRYRNQFLNETTKETQAKIDSGEYILTNLNG